MAEPVLSAVAEGPDYYGLPTCRLTGDRLWLDLLPTAGPRIIRLGLSGSAENLFAETADAGWPSPLGRYEMRGGHRLWFAPEVSELVAVPDDAGTTLQVDRDRVRASGPVEPSTGLVRSIEVRLNDAGGFEVRHELANRGPASLQLAPWPITQLPLGGVALVPEPAAIDSHVNTPNRSLVLWPYTARDDSRLGGLDGAILVRGRAGRELKIGSYIEAGWLGYLRQGTLFVRRFAPVPRTSLPDLGCNVEIYCGDAFLELETLGPLVDLAAGASVTFGEAWEVHRLGEPDRGTESEQLLAALRAGAGSPPTR